MKLGALFGLSTSKEQSQFLNEAGRALRRSAVDCGFEMQCSAIVDDLDQDGKLLITEIARMIKSDATRLGGKS